MFFASTSVERYRVKRPTKRESVLWHACSSPSAPEITQGGIVRFGSMARGSIRAETTLWCQTTARKRSPRRQCKPQDGVRLAWILPALAANASQTFTLEEGAGATAVTVADGKYGLDVHLNGELFTTYHHAANHNKLFLYPVIGPTGKGMTRGYPMVSDIAGEKHDHPHHKSIHVAHGDVNGVDLWSELDDHGYQRHDSFPPAFGAGNTFVSGPVCGAFRSRSYWVSRDEQPVVAEEKRVVVYAPAPDARILDIAVTFHATEGPVRFGDTKEGAMLSVRVASSMDADADGTIENAYGGRGETECFGKRAQWMDYAGPVDGKTVGVAVFDHPSSFRYPTYWHMRNYGLMHANPFAWREFLGHPGVDGSYVCPKARASIATSASTSTPATHKTPSSQTATTTSSPHRWWK